MTCLFVLYKFLDNKLPREFDSQRVGKKRRKKRTGLLIISTAYKLIAFTKSPFLSVLAIGFRGLIQY